MSEFYSVISLIERPDLKDRLADWFHQKWEIPKDAYLESMEECLGGKGPVPQWYAVLDEEKIIAGHLQRLFSALFPVRQAAPDF